MKTVLRKIFGHKRKEVLGGQRKLREEEFHNLYYSPDITTIVFYVALRSLQQPVVPSVDM
jgi:hypothetical protein